VGIISNSGFAEHYVPWLGTLGFAMPQENERPERDLTDESLTVERAKSDAALAEKAVAEHVADVVVEHARESADEVLFAARAKADVKLADSTLLPAQTRAAVKQERVMEDQVVDGERAAADETLRQQRAAHARLLATLIPAQRDKTDQRLLTERARADDALTNRDDFLGMVSHDLRDLLGGIVINAATIAKVSEAGEDGSVARLSADRIQRSAARMARLISDLVDTASIDAGNLRVTPRAEDAGKVLADALELWRDQASANRIVLEARLSTAVQVKIDRDRILQVLGNLITNAMKFSSIGAVVVGFDVVGSDGRFSVKDSGVGIPQDKLESIFDRFWQVRKEDRRGLGLGLYIARCLVQAHGGQIWVESEVGAGSTFFFTVPCA
jgi:signal transduction histidine kinase